MKAFLPKFYLKYFADSSNKVLCTWKGPTGGLKEKALSPAEVGHEQDSDVAPVMKLVVERGPDDLNAAERRVWATFLSSLIESHALRSGDSAGPLDIASLITHLEAMEWVTLQATGGARELPVVTGDDPVHVTKGVEGQINFVSFALTPTTLFFLYPGGEPPDEKERLSLLITHALTIFGQCEYVYTKDPLLADDVIGFRLSAEERMKPPVAE
jgi:hypothetical protein